jgi:3-isopropylmalate/(R)-2-methylmalate dehydratase large subunit
LVTTHDWYVVNFDKVMQELGIDRLHAPHKLLISTDHEPVATSPLAAQRQRQVREVVRKYGIEHFYDVGRGGHGHVFPMEKGYVRPGMLVIAYDIHVTNYGALGCMGIPVVTEISEVLACGNVWLKVPHTVRINLVGRLGPGITMRDVAQKMISVIPVDAADYAAFEIGGPGLASVDFAGRQVLCNTPIEIGAKTAFIEPDQQTLDYLKGRTTEPVELIKSDADARFHTVIEFDLGLVEPQVAAPPTPDNVVGVSQLVGKKIDHAFLGSCAAPGIGDLAIAARILKGKHIHQDVRFFVTPSTYEVMSQATELGYMQTLIDAGASITAPGCGVCAGGKIGAMADGEVSINTGTRNDFGRLGAMNSEIYLASAATVAASALAGAIADPRPYLLD